MEVDSFEYQVQQLENAEGKRSDSDHAEKPEGFFGKPDQEKYGEDIEKATRVGARSIHIVVPITLGLAQGHLADAEALSFSQQRQEALLFSVKVDFLEDSPAKRACIASQV